ncbi:MAG: NAD-dependent epimerase/dehydratase family protein [Candidatus Dormibacteraeota bacterium]|nr:NAD-dependent epimerase/dehydratase family protein [Candidatus Dormibacteraeota bacterium]
MSVDEVFLTGATGFIGCHILDALLEGGHPVRALVRSPGRLPRRSGLTEVVGDVTRAGGLVESMRGCRALIHTAAAYSFAPAERSRIRATNVAGTAGILEAARLAGVERAVVTSSSATVGAARAHRPATEDDHADEHGHSAYHDSKIAAERVALAARLPAVILLPTAPVGPGDWKPTPTGAALLTFLRGRVLASVTGGLNVVAVADVARAHVAALERGQLRRRYLIAGENVSFDELWRRLGAVSGRRPPRRRMPHAIVMLAALADEARCRVMRGAQPLVPLEGARMARHHMYVESTRARDELGVERTSVDVALEQSVRWYRDHGYVGA